MFFGVRKLTQSAMRLFFVHKSNMYLLSSVWFQWRQHLVVRPEHWPPIEQSLHLLMKFFVLFIIRNQNIGSTSHSWRVRRTPFLLRLLTHWFHNAKVCAVFFLPKKRGTAGSSTKWRRLRTDWGREFHTVLMTRQCATAPIWLVVRRAKFASAKVRHVTRECELLITGQEIAGLKEGLGVVVLAL